jgi:alkyl hydroperoxide reductase subunit AhpF
MMGLENTNIFSVLMVTGVLVISGILAITTWLRGNVETWNSGKLLPEGIPGVS